MTDQPLLLAPLLLAIGSYTEAKPASGPPGDGVSLLRFDPRTGRIETLDRLDLGNPSYLRWHGRESLHVALEFPDARAGLATVRVDPQAGRLTLLEERRIEGTDPCHLDVHPAGRHLAIACYGSGHVIIHRLDEDGVPEAVTSVVRHAGTSVHPKRQDRPHPHAAAFSPDGAWLLVPDLGTDEIWCHAFDPVSGTLGAATRSQMPAGSGPRQCLFDASGRIVVVVHELSCQVTTLAFDNGTLTPLSSCDLLDGPVGPTDTGSALRFDPQRRTVIASVRGSNLVRQLDLGADGQLTRQASFGSGGARPRDLDVSAGWVLCGNQDSGQLVAMPTLGSAGADPSRPSNSFAIGRPTCVRFAPA